MPSDDVVLILQIGSLGDTVISLPCYREIARRHPAADRYLLTNYPIGSKMVQAEAVLRPTGMIAGCIEYPMPLRSIGRMAELYRRIVALKPGILYYLLPETRTANLLRHYAFFKFCGIPRIVGMPWSRSNRHSRELPPGGIWESEACRLLRSIGVIGGPPADSDRDLVLTNAEHEAADNLLRGWAGSAGFVALSVGGKVPINNWGDENWGAVLHKLSADRPLLGLVLVGSADERPRNDRLAAHWQGPSLNTCGQLTPRETAALLARAGAFLGHDTGTLHLAAAVNTPVIGVFSARNEPGIWYSDRTRDTFFFNRVACTGCRLVQIEDCPNNRICMDGHDPNKIVAAVEHAVPV
jgi:ADP-heptose:LPS heptosyltransferase